MFFPPDERRMSRLGWIDAPRASLAQWDDLTRLADAARGDGFTRAVVCGMGGSSLAPQVLATSFGAPSLVVLDSTDPAAVLAIERAGIGNTLFVISSKSGTTVETLAFYHYFVARARPGQFVAITDPASPLETLARERGFPARFHHPVSERRLDSEVVAEFWSEPLDLGVEFLTWEYATWELGERLGVNAFDQPDVEEAKALARAELAGGPVGAPPAAPLPTMTPEALRRAARPGDYVAILAYLPPPPEVAAGLQEVRGAWARARDCATTLGFGPRYLHSTGQLHKGGPNTGLFLVITAEDAEDAEVPEMGLTV